MKSLKFLTIIILTIGFFGCTTITDVKIPAGLTKSLDVISTQYATTVNATKRSIIASTKDENANYIISFKTIDPTVLEGNTPQDIAAVCGLIVYENMTAQEIGDKDILTIEVPVNNSIVSVEFNRNDLKQMNDCKQKANEFIAKIDEQNFNPLVNMVDLKLMGNIDSTEFVKSLSGLESGEYGELNTYSIYGFEKGSETIAGTEMNLSKIKFVFQYEKSRHTGEIIFNDLGKIVGLVL